MRMVLDHCSNCDSMHRSNYLYKQFRYHFSLKWSFVYSRYKINKFFSIINLNATKSFFDGLLFFILTHLTHLTHYNSLLVRNKWGRSEIMINYNDM